MGNLGRLFGGREEPFDVLGAFADCGCDAGREKNDVQNDNQWSDGSCHSNRDINADCTEENGEEGSYGDEEGYSDRKNLWCGNSGLWADCFDFASEDRILRQCRKKTKKGKGDLYEKGKNIIAGGGHGADACSLWRYKGHA